VDEAFGCHLAAEGAAMPRPKRKAYQRLLASTRSKRKRSRLAQPDRLRPFLRFIVDVNASTAFGNRRAMPDAAGYINAFLPFPQQLPRYRLAHGDRDKNWYSVG
jgi:hypothetical protein